MIEGLDSSLFVWMRSVDWKAFTLVSSMDRFVERVVTPYGALVVETLWDERSEYYPVGTVRVVNPGYRSLDFPDPEYLTIEHMVDLRINVLVYPSGEVESYDFRELDISYPLPDRGRGVSKIVMGEDLKLVLPVIKNAATQVQGKEGFMDAAVRHDALYRYRRELEKVLDAEDELEYARRSLTEQAEQVESLGLTDRIKKLEKNVRKERRNR